MARCPYYKILTQREEFIGSLGVNHPLTCGIKECPYNNLDKTTRICRTEGLIKKIDIQQTARDSSKNIKGFYKLKKEIIK